MNREFIHRLCKAKKYQTMAIKELLPKNVVKHIDVIENELKEMMIECIGDLIIPEVFETAEIKEKNKTNKNIKKVDIG